MQFAGIVVAIFIFFLSSKHFIQNNVFFSALKYTLMKMSQFIHTNNFMILRFNYNPRRQMWCFEVITSEKGLQRLIFLLFTVSDVITLIFSIMLNSTCDDSVNTNTGLKCTSIDLLQLRTLWNNVMNTTRVFYRN